MTAFDLTDPIFSNETKARAYFEGIRWPDGPICPHCGERERVYRLDGETTRPGLFRCNGCDGQFTVMTGTVMESSHLPLAKWAFAFRLYAGSKKGFSAHQLHRSLGITYKSAWFMAHRVREAMSVANPETMGGAGKIIEADETYYGRTEPRVRGPKKRNRGTAGKAKIVSLVERGGPARSFKVDSVDAATINKIVADHASFESRLMTDEAPVYGTVGWQFAKHEKVTAWRKRIRARRRDNEHGRGFLFNFQTRHERRLSALQRCTLAPLSQRI
jgi:transposase-like protein